LTENGDSGSATVAPPDAVHPTRRRLELTLALVAAVAAIAAAILGTFASIRAASIESAESPRIEVLDAYSTYVGATGDLLVRTRRIGECDPDPELGSFPLIEEYDVQAREYGAASTRVFLVGSKRVGELEIQISSLVKVLQHNLVQMSQDGHQLGRLCFTDAVLADETHENLEGLLTDLMNAAREETREG
jgi:hypothetical protein